MSDFDNELDMEREDIVELVDEDGNEVSFEHLMTLEHKGKSYILLAPLETTEDIAEDEMVILEIQTDEDGYDFYASIEDEALVNEIFAEYLEIAEADGEE